MGSRVRAFAVVAVSVLLSASATIAGGPPYGQGQHLDGFGPHWLLDSSEYPAVTCSYSRGVLYRIVMRKPIIYALDRTSQDDRQWVGWRAVFQYADLVAGADTQWVELTRTPTVYAIADEQNEARFRNLTFNVLPSIKRHSIFRVKYLMTWYYPTKGQRYGVAVHWPLYYLEHDPTGDVMAEESCSTTSE